MEAAKVAVLLLVTMVAAADAAGRGVNGNVDKVVKPNTFLGSGTSLGSSIGPGIGSGFGFTFPVSGFPYVGVPGSSGSIVGSGVGEAKMSKTAVTDAKKTAFIDAEGRGVNGNVDKVVKPNSFLGPGTSLGSSIGPGTGSGFGFTFPVFGFPYVGVPSPGGSIVGSGVGEAKTSKTAITDAEKTAFIDSKKTAVSDVKKP